MNLRSILVKVSATIAVVLAVCMACFVFYTSHILEREIKDGVVTTVKQDVALAMDTVELFDRTMNCIWTTPHPEFHFRSNMTWDEVEKIVGNLVREESELGLNDFLSIEEIK